MTGPQVRQHVPGRLGERTCNRSQHRLSAVITYKLVALAGFKYFGGQPILWDYGVVHPAAYTADETECGNVSPAVAGHSAEDH